MKAVILAGGLGTRMGYETKNKPKPMVKIGSKPILWHIMKYYSYFDVKDFVICCGYKIESIKKFFKTCNEDWNVTLVNTGTKTMTGGRLKKIKKYVENQTFCFTYGDTLNDLDIQKVINFHTRTRKFATVTACIPPEKYGILKIRNTKVIKFEEKPKQEKWVNGGYFVLEPEIFDYIEGNLTSWEKEPMQKLVTDGQLNAFKHFGFYQPMDTIYEKEILEKLWNLNKAPWKKWK